MVKKIINSLIQKPFDIVEELVFGTSNEKNPIGNVTDKQKVEIGENRNKKLEAKEQAETFYPKCGNYCWDILLPLLICCVMD